MNKIIFKKGVKTRFIIHQILYSIKYKNRNFDDIFESIKIKENLNLSDSKLINDVVLNSMRKFLFIEKIINIYSKNKPTKHQYILLISSIVQLVFLNYKNYAVINCSVEIAKHKKIKAVPGYINSILKKIDKNKSKLYNTCLHKKDLKKIPNYKIFNEVDIKDLLKIFNSTSIKPQTHLVFKNKLYLKNFNFIKLKSTNISVVFDNKKNLSELNEFKKGYFWVQDFSAMLPLYLTKISKNYNIIDFCSAPGGKTFQLIQKGANVLSVEKNFNRASLLRKNLDRLNYKSSIKIEDALNLNVKKKYDMVIIDAPCSSVGTIRRNPDIIFKNQKINMKNNVAIQKKLLEKADKLISKNGIIIYMVCSFLKNETYLQINNFLKKNNYYIEKFIAIDEYSSLIDNSGFINIIPQNFNNLLIDGFFAAKLIKND